MVNSEELEALYGLPHMQQLAYLRGIRPYMDVQTGITGIKRGISYQSIAEQLDVESKPGVKGSHFSRDQIKRVLASLERAGLILNQSQNLKLILECLLATKNYFVQNKPALNPPQQAAPLTEYQHIESKQILCVVTDKPALNQPDKAAPPLYSSNNYVFLLKQHFEQFWSLYPVKNAEQKAWEVFQAINPTEALVTQMLKALQAQIHYVQRQQSFGHWVPNWKNPANWLAQRCWNDVIPIEQQFKEDQHAKNQADSRKQQSSDPLWASCKPDNEEADTSFSNVIEFSKWGR